MSNKQIMGVCGIFIMGTLLACLCSGRWLLSGETNIFNALASFNVMTVESGGGWGIAKSISSYFNGIVTALTWNYPFLSSPWAIIIKFPLWILSIGTVYGLIELSINAVQGLVGTIRSLIPGL